MEGKSNFTNPEVINSNEFFSFNDISEFLTCRICFNILIAPVECITCRNLYCSYCLHLWQQTSSEIPCPFRCENSILTTNCRLILTLLEKLVLKCHRCSDGIKYANLLSHIKIYCRKKIFRCQNQGCNFFITPQILEAHNKLCLTKGLNQGALNKSTNNQNLSNEEKIEAWNFISDMLEIIQEENEVFIHNAIFHLISQKLNNSGLFLDSEKLKIIFDKFLKYYSNIVEYRQFYLKLEYTLDSLLGNHIDLFKVNKNLINELICKIYNVYSMESKSYDDLHKAIFFLSTTCTTIYKNIKPLLLSSVYKSQIIESSLRYLKHTDAYTSRFINSILGDILLYENDSHLNQEFFEDLENILNSLSDFLNYKFDVPENKTLMEYERDYTIFAIGKIIYYRHEHLKASEWIPKWLSFFSLELVNQELSYKYLCRFLNKKPQILIGLNY